MHQRSESPWTRLGALGTIGLLALPGCGSEPVAGPPDAAGRDADAGATADAPAPADAAPDERLFIVPPLEACDAGAPAPDQVRVVSWNMHAARDATYDEIAAALASVDADVILLQEVDGYTPLDDANQAEEVATRLGLSYVFAQSVEFQGRLAGLATLSRLPLASARRISLASAAASEPRIALDVEVCFGPQPVHVVNVHMDYVPEANLENTTDMLAAMAGALGQGVMVAGDFNAQPGAPAIQAMLDAGLIDVVAPYDSAPTWQDRRLDYVFADTPLSDAAQRAEVVPTDKSDHSLVVVDF